MKFKLKKYLRNSKMDLPPSGLPNKTQTDKNLLLISHIFKQAITNTTNVLNSSVDLPPGLPSKTPTNRNQQIFKQTENKANKIFYEIQGSIYHQLI